MNPGFVAAATRRCIFPNHIGLSFHESFPFQNQSFATLRYVAIQANHSSDLLSYCATIIQRAYLVPFTKFERFQAAQFSQPSIHIQSLALTMKRHSWYQKLDRERQSLLIKSTFASAFGRSNCTTIKQPF